MATYKLQQELLPSLLDRITDLEPRNRNEAPQNRAQGMRQIRISLRRDLEWLLNTRQRITPVPEWCKELPNSVFTYGLPDLTSFTLNSERDQMKLTSLIEMTIETFEPRLKNILVLVVPVAQSTRMLKFQIEALLRVEPAPERILFDTTLDLSCMEYRVEGETGAR
jgi:type VI secretion system protein ImpF